MQPTCSPQVSLISAQLCRNLGPFGGCRLQRSRAEAVGRSIHGNSQTLSENDVSSQPTSKNNTKAFYRLRTLLRPRLRGKPGMHRSHPHAPNRSSPMRSLVASDLLDPALPCSCSGLSPLSPTARALPTRWCVHSEGAQSKRSLGFSSRSHRCYFARGQSTSQLARDQPRSSI